MIDLRMLRDRWSEEGARSIFAALVTHCVRFVYPSAQAVRPDPGDEGLDTFVGEFDDELHVYQAKYFADGIGAAQKSQIRASWRSCTGSKRFKKIASWTLCVPIELSVDEHTWWQGWRKKQANAYGCQIELWGLSRFQGFSCQPTLTEIFNHALERGRTHATTDEVVSGMRGAAGPRALKRLPTEDHLVAALFVKKLEAAGWLKHRAARTAFYNFELLRTAVEQGGSVTEQAALVDMRERVYGLWEHAYNEANPNGLGRALVAEVEKRVRSEHNASLKCSLPAGEVHKIGAVHDWADLCQAGWTLDFEAFSRESAES
jgi:hypothetical protein